jgi:adenylate cyclase
VKTPGDAILAVFWQERRGVSHSACALRSAREILANLPKLARAWEAVGVKFDIGIGINAGPVAIGLVGKRHLEPTVIGDNVNIAQRLEDLTKTLGCPLIFSESVRERLGEDVEAACLDEVSVKGRKAPIRIYGMGHRSQAGAERAEKERA